MIFLGGGQFVWILLELFYLPALSILQGVYGPIGVGLLLLPFTSAVSEHFALT